MNQPHTSTLTCFELLKQQLGDLVEQSARETKAFQRARKVKSPWDLLWLVFCFVFHKYSMALLAAEFSQRFETITEEAVHKRLLSTLEWLQFLTDSLIKKRVQAWHHIANRIVIFDSTLCHTDRNPDQHVQVTFGVDLLSLCTCYISSTIGQSAEMFGKPEGVGKLIFMGDANFCKQKNIQKTLLGGDDFIVRYRSKSMNLYDEHGEKADLHGELAKLHKRGVLYRFNFQIPYATSSSKKARYRPDWSEKCWPVHVYALRLPEDVAVRKVDEHRKRSAKKGRKQSAASRFMAEWVVLVTSVPGESLSGESMMELYRFRWQIELIFRRLKQTLKVMHGNAKSQSRIHLVSIYGSLLAHLLMDEHVQSKWFDSSESVINSSKRGMDRVWKLTERNWAAELLIVVPVRNNAIPETKKWLGGRKRRHRAAVPSPELQRWMGEKANADPDVTASAA